MSLLHSNKIPGWAEVEDSMAKKTVKKVKREKPSAFPQITGMREHTIVLG